MWENVCAKGRIQENTLVEEAQRSKDARKRPNSFLQHIRPVIQKASPIFHYFPPPDYLSKDSERVWKTALKIFQLCS